MDEALQKAGETVRRTVLGDDYVDRAIEQYGDFSRPFQRYSTKILLGHVLDDRALTQATQPANLGMLAALGRMHEFGVHFRGAMRKSPAMTSSARR